MSVDVSHPPAAGPAAADCCTPRFCPDVDPAAAESLAALAKVLSDPIRVQVVDVLRRHSGEVCQCHLAPLFDIAQPTLSHHLRKLADAGVIDVERRGKWAYYSLNRSTMEDLKAWLS